MMAPSKLRLSLDRQRFIEEKENIADEMEEKTTSSVGTHHEELHRQDGETWDSNSSQDAMLEQLLKEKEALAQKLSERETREHEQSSRFQSMRNRLQKRIKALEEANSSLRKEVAVLNRVSSSDSLTTLNRSLQNEVNRLTMENLVS